MAQIVERARVACPAGAAHVFIDRDFALRRDDGSDVGLHVRVPLWGLLALDKDVDVHVRPAHGTGEAYAFDVDWEPSGGPFPSFCGVLRVLPDGDDAAQIELAGHYDPPGGPFGAIFERLAGRRIAQATLRELLERIGRSLSDEYSRRLNTAAS